MYFVTCFPKQELKKLLEATACDLMVTVERLEQPLNAELPILVTELGMVMLVNPVHPSNAEPSMLVTELGMVISVRFVQFLNFSRPMLVTFSPKIYFVTCSPKQELKRDPEEATTACDSMVTVLRFVQPLNAKYAILVTELGMVMSVKPVQPLNALAAMLVTELGMVMSVRPVQSWYL